MSPYCRGGNESAKKAAGETAATRCTPARCAFGSPAAQRGRWENPTSAAVFLTGIQGFACARCALGSPPAQRLRECDGALRRGEGATCLASAQRAGRDL